MAVVEAVVFNFTRDLLRPRYNMQLQAQFADNQQSLAQINVTHQRQSFQRH